MFENRDSTTHTYHPKYVCSNTKCPYNRSERKSVSPSTGNEEITKSPNIYMGDVCTLPSEEYQFTIRGKRGENEHSRFNNTKRCYEVERELSRKTRTCIKCKDTPGCLTYSIPSLSIGDGDGYRIEIADACIKKEECEGILYPSGDPIAKGHLSCYREGNCPIPQSIWTNVGGTHFMCSKTCLGRTITKQLEGGLEVEICEQTEKEVLQSWGKVKGEHCVWDNIKLECTSCLEGHPFQVMRYTTTHPNSIYFGECGEGSVQNDTHYTTYEFRVTDPPEMRKVGMIYPARFCHSELFGVTRYLTWVEGGEERECIYEKKCEEASQIIIDMLYVVHLCKIETPPRHAMGEGCYHKEFGECIACKPGFPFMIYEDYIIEDCTDHLDYTPQNLVCMYKLLTIPHPEIYNDNFLHTQKHMVCGVLEGEDNTNIIRIVDGEGKFMKNFWGKNNPKCKGQIVDIHPVGLNNFSVCELPIDSPHLSLYTGIHSQIERDCLPGYMPLIKKDKIIDCVKDCPVHAGTYMKITSFGHFCFLDSCLCDVPTALVYLTDPKIYIRNQPITGEFQTDEYVCMTNVCY